MSYLRFTVSLGLAWAAMAGEPGMIFIPAGEYERGRAHEDKNAETKWYPNLLKDDQPVRRIHVDAFLLDEHEVTNGEYARFVAATKRRAPIHWPGGVARADDAQRPVTNVSWDDAQAYARWRGKRLPTEAEWERAARGLSDDGRKFFTGADKLSDTDAHYSQVGGPGTVCEHRRNDFGLCDIAGNVWEWTADWYEQRYYEKSPSRNPAGPAAGQYRVIRGGSWADVAEYLTCSYRGWVRPSERSPNIGFRCAKPVQRPASSR